MLKFIIKRIKQTVITIFILSLGAFMVSHLAPGDPLVSVYGDAAERLSNEARIKAVKDLRLDKPLIYQYAIWIKNAVKGDLGYSYKYKMPVKDVIQIHFPNTFYLMGLSIFLTLILSISLGLISALNEGKLLDRIITRFSTLLYCIPGFWISLILILVFCTNLKILPSSGVYDIGRENDILNRIYHLILPLTVMIIGHLGYYSNFVRNKILEELKEDYIILARAKGLSKFEIISKHPLKKIMPSIIILMSLSLSHLIAGGFVVEYIFSYPGVGKLVFESAKYHDYPLLMGGVILTGVIVVLGSLISDILSSLIDPRLREEGMD
ncbi:ABC transporter permease [Tepidibacter formicigenes]|jgi:peptide/nickel transport system permease protein|uniref:Peptide/nickel transport system permease protein n=1 Tax=Tepidibacter formicigenes DSM 15518 TaxID=1123349 RepID=A0A1M6MSN4_9FIRM|nr:ABC transporter permease [Tepidibacter formicigenes]SHJ86422.1 peptide/nickel transport system permease protein [Tepidibacter formicigenes DSM 15518]